MKLRSSLKIYSTLILTFLISLVFPKTDLKAQGYWKNLGPFYPYVKNINPVGVGWIDAIWVDPNDRDHLMVGARSGGLYESRDKGESWKCLTNNIPSFGVFDIDVNPKNPKDILISTGLAGGGFYKFQHHTLGIFRTTDGGKTWNRTNSPFELTTASDIERDPFNPHHLFTVYSKHESYWSKQGSEFSGNYLLESWDFGSTWKKVEVPNEGDREIRELRFSAKNKGQIYLAGKGLFMKSKDNGRSWTDQFSMLVEEDKKAAPSTISLDENFILALDQVQFGNDEILGIYCHNAKYASNVSGNRLFQIYNGERVKVLIHPSSLTVGNKGQVGRPLIRMNPDNPNQIYYGKTYLVRLHWDTENNKLDPKKSGRFGRRFHDDMRDLLVLDSNNIYVGCDGGFIHSGDGAKTWSMKMGSGNFPTSSRISNTEFYDFDVTYFKGAPLVMGGAQDNSSFMYYKGEWMQHGGGDGGVSKVLAQNDESVYFTVNANYFTKLTRMDSFPVFKGSRSFSFASALYERVIFTEPGVEGALILGKVPEGTQCQYPSKRTGKGWRNQIQVFNRIEEDFPNKCYTGANFTELPGYPQVLQDAWNAEKPYNKYPYNNISAVKQSAEKPNNILFATCDWGVVNLNLFRTSNGGKTWENVANTLPKDLDRSRCHVSGIELDPEDPKRIWISISHFQDSKKVFETRDGGNSWKNISRGMHSLNIPCNDLEFDPASRVLYAANDMGVYHYKVDEDFSSWKELYPGLPRVRVGRIKALQENRTLYVMTWGKGIWECPLIRTGTQNQNKASFQKKKQPKQP